MKTTRTAGIMLATGLLALCLEAQAQIYKIVDKDGNVIYTDQAPADGTPPMELPELSVVKTEPIQPEDSTPAAGESEGAEPTLRELRRMYRDFRITQPVPEETFWGTSNSVVVGWGTGTPLQPDMRVRLLVDGEVQSETQDNMVALTLDRGAHVVQAELLDGRGRRLVSTQPVTFFLHQGSENFNRPRPQPKGGP